MGSDAIVYHPNLAGTHAVSQFSLVEPMIVSIATQPSLAIAPPAPVDQIDQENQSRG